MGMSVGALADTEITPSSDPQKGETLVTLTKEESYIVTIPAKVDLSEESPETIGISGVLIDENDTLKITVTSTHEWNLQNSKGNATIPYHATVNGANLKDNGGLVLSKKGAEAQKTESVEIDFNLDGTATVAGNYSDTLTFNVSCEAGE